MYLSPTRSPSPGEKSVNLCRSAVCLFLLSDLGVSVPAFTPNAPGWQIHSILLLSLPIPPTQSPETAKPPKLATDSKKHPDERGYAAFYSASLQGHKTACGGVYSSTELTAAHPTLRCGTRLRVTNLRNGKSVRVTVNDHGPAKPNRIIDLSYAAAQSLDFIQQGTTLVKVEVLH
jgi:hypothetical protein